MATNLSKSHSAGLYKKLFNSANIRKLLSYDLNHPTEQEKKKIIQIIRKLKFDELEFFYKELVDANIIRAPYADVNNERRRRKRATYYINKISRITNPILDKLPSNAVICDVGCGTGALTAGVFKARLQDTKVFACDILDYFSPSLKKEISFTQQDVMKYLQKTKNETFDVIMEIVLLHHLPTSKLAKQGLQEMIRVTKEGGHIILVETVPSNWRQSLSDHVLDKLLNDRTSRFIGDFIPVPLNIFSHKDLLREFKKYNVKLVKQVKLPPNSTDPKNHKIYILRK